MKLRKFLLPMLLCCFLTACHEDMDDVITPVGTLEIKDFIWKGMNDIYLYKSDVSALADDRFESQQELNEFLEGFSSPEDLFYDGLVAPQDEFSFLVDDYIELENSLDGIGLSNGMQYGLVRYSSSSENVLGYVRYVLPNTSAEEQGIERGELFNTVDGEQLTISNFSRLLESSTYTIGMAELNGSQVVPTEEEVTLQKEQYTANPVYLTRTIETSNSTVGYLMYNGFTGTFDPQLNAAFAQFKAEGVTDLVLDFRYNGGGSVETAVDLASMVTGQFEGEVFATEHWNQGYQAYFEENDPERLVNRFNNQIRTGEAINSLNLQKVYVITTLRTASASELVINGLEPYIEVVQVGENTTGKFQASITLYDSENFSRRNVNPGHTYAIQPLVYKSANSAGKTDYLNGLPPDIEIREDIAGNLGILGDPSEPLLNAALNHIEGNTQSLKKSVRNYEVVGEAGMNAPLYQKMYAEEAPSPVARPLRYFNN